MSWQHYKKLIVWQKAMCLTDEIYNLAKRLPKEELFALSYQMRRAAISIPSNIAEGHGRQTEKEYKQFFLSQRVLCVNWKPRLKLGFDSIILLTTMLVPHWVCAMRCEKC